MKKFISLFLVVSILTLSIPLTAKERKGADLIIQKTDGTQVRGELIAVKQNSLLMMERDSGADVTVDITDVNVITIVKKSKAGAGALFGFLIGGSGWVVYAIGENATESPSEEVSDFAWTLTWGLVFGAAFAAIGWLMGSAMGKDETIQFEGKSDVEIQEILEYLRKKARIRNSQ